jgi:hypothetical protein
VATNAPDLNLPAATNAPDLNLPEAIKAPDLNLVPSAILAREPSLTPATGAFVLAARATSSASSGKGEVEEHRTNGLSRTSERRATLLNRSRVLRGEDILRLVKTKDIRVTRTNHNHNLQQQGLEKDGMYELGNDELAGYLSEGGQSVSVHNTIIELVVSAVQAEMPNAAIIKAKQEAYEKVMQSNEQLLNRQQQEYQSQNEKLLALGQRQVQDHQRLMDKMKAESEKMMADSAKMREDYAKAIVLNSEISIDEVSLAQAAKYDDALAKRAAMKAKSMESQYKAEKEKRMRREEDLRIAEARIADLESTIKELEGLVDDKPKRPLPERAQSASPETQAKKSKPRGNSGPSSPSFIPSSAPIIPLISSITPSRTSVAPFANLRESSSTDPSESGLSDDEDTSSSSANSHEVVLPVQTETVTQNCSDTCARNTKGDNCNKVEVPVSRVTPRVNGLYTDEEMGHLTLETWRARLRAMHDYIPDRAWAEHVHLDKVKVLQAALSNFKKSVAEQHLHGRNVLNYRHDKYEYMRQQYHVPENTCTPKELHSKMADGNQLYLHRCVPLSRFYSMLIEDTPGYVPSPVEPIKPAKSVKHREPAARRPHRQDHRPLNKAPVA